MSKAALTKQFKQLDSEIFTVSGDYFSFLDPGSYAFQIEAIAHALSHLCRFNGHTRVFYSVAQHSVLVSSIVPQELKLAALLHDATEAFVGDITKPLKDMIPGFREVEKKLEAALFTYYGVERPLPEAIKKADMIVLATEQRDFMPRLSLQWDYLADVTPLPEKIIAWQPALAKKHFLDCYYSLRKAAHAA